MSKIGSLDDSDTLLTLNTPDVKQRISDGFTDSVASLPAQQQTAATERFEKFQADYSSKVTHAFSASLTQVFATSAVLMTIAAVLVMFIRERELKHASAEATPGEL